MKKAILTFGLLLTAIVLTSYVEPTPNEVKIDKTTSTMDQKGGNSGNVGQ